MGAYIPNICILKLTKNRSNQYVILIYNYNLVCMNRQHVLHFKQLSNNCNSPIATTSSTYIHNWDVTHVTCIMQL